MDEALAAVTTAAAAGALSVTAVLIARARRGARAAPIPAATPVLLFGADHGHGAAGRDPTSEDGDEEPSAPITERALATLGPSYVVLRGVRPPGGERVDYVVVGPTGVFVLDARAEDRMPGDPVNYRVERAGRAVVRVAAHIGARVPTLRPVALAVDLRVRGAARLDWVEVEQQGVAPAWIHGEFLVGSPEAVVTVMLRSRRQGVTAADQERYVAEALRLLTGAGSGPARRPRPGRSAEPPSAEPVG